MSIINDALKKVQNNISPKSPEEPKPENKAPAPKTPSSASPAAPSAQPQPASPVIRDRPISEKPAVPSADDPTAKSGKAKRPAFRTPAPVIIVVSVCLLAIAVLLTRWTPIDVQPLPQKTTAGLNGAPQLSIQGIMTMGDRKVVLIEEDIYQIGDEIQGMKVKEISLDEVKLLKDGRTVTIKVKP